jgi:hypothetical protein
MAHYERMGAGVLDGIAKFIVFTKIEISWVIRKLEDQERWVTY